MKTLQIHIGKLNNLQKKCIESKSSIYSDCNHIFIKDNNYYKLLLKMCNDYNINISKFDNETPQGRVIISDFLRVYLMSLIPYILYIDTDVECLKKFIPFSKEYSYFVKNDIWCIYNGSETGKFKNFLIGKQPPLLLVDIAKEKGLNLIEDKYFKHYNLRSWKNQ